METFKKIEIGDKEYVLEFIAGRNIQITDSGTAYTIGCDLEVMEFKGVVDSEGDLPKDNNTLGNTYVAKDTGKMYVWTQNNEWVNIGGSDIEQLWSYDGENSITPVAGHQNLKDVDTIYKDDKKILLNNGIKAENNGQPFMATADADIITRKYLNEKLLETLTNMAGMFVEETLIINDDEYKLLKKKDR